MQGICSAEWVGVSPGLSSMQFYSDSSSDSTSTFLYVIIYVKDSTVQVIAE